MEGVGQSDLTIEVPIMAKKAAKTKSARRPLKKLVKKIQTGRANLMENRAERLEDRSRRLKKRAAKVRATAKS
jgi:hypothetical protein